MGEDKLTELAARLAHSTDAEVRALWKRLCRAADTPEDRAFAEGAAECARLRAELARVTAERDANKALLDIVEPMRQDAAQCLEMCREQHQACKRELATAQRHERGLRNAVICWAARALDWEHTEPEGPGTGWEPGQRCTSWLATEVRAGDIRAAARQRRERS